MTSWFKIVDIKSIFNAALFLLMSSNTFSQTPAEIIPDLAFSDLIIADSRSTILNRGKKSLLYFLMQNVIIASMPSSTSTKI